MKKPDKPEPKPTPDHRAKEAKKAKGWACHICGLVNIETEQCPVDGNVAP